MVVFWKLIQVRVGREQVVIPRGTSLHGRCAHMLGYDYFEGTIYGGVWHGVVYMVLWYGTIWCCVV